jgi:hypothetical protein
MAGPNVPITPGNGGLIVAADDVTDPSLGGISTQVQYIKLMDGTIGSFNKATVDSGGHLLVTGTLGNFTGNISAAPYVYTPLGYTQITNVSAAVGISPPGNATVAILSAEGYDLRYRDDGVNPTATIGMPLYVGSPLTYQGNLSAIKVIQTAGSSGQATLNVSFSK